MSKIDDLIAALNRNADLIEQNQIQQPNAQDVSQMQMQHYAEEEMYTRKQTKHINWQRSEKL